MPDCWFKHYRIAVLRAVLITGVGLWPLLDVQAAFALPCGLNCENITGSPNFSMTLNGSDQTISYTLGVGVDNVSVLGWNLTVTSTQFATGTTPVHTLPMTNSFITGVQATCSQGQICTSLPQNTVTYPITLPIGNPAPTPVKFYNAGNTSGVGTFDISATITIPVPANSYAGTYNNTFTVAYVSGP